eukprot:COSAG02_NODE_5958_length_3912_cov_2.499082_4_plen_46_part_00
MTNSQKLAKTTIPEGCWRPHLVDHILKDHIRKPRFTGSFLLSFCP